MGVTNNFQGRLLHGARVLKSPRSSGVTLAEIILTISLISVGVLPLIAGLSNMAETALIQKDQLSAMTLGTLQMDTWLMQFQAIDAVQSPAASAYIDHTVISPPIPPGNVSVVTDEGAPYRDVYYNGSFFRVETTFTHMNGQGGAPDLSNNDKIVYRLHVKVWRIQNPLLNDDQNVPQGVSYGAPSFYRGDEIYYELTTLYAQNNIFNPVFSDQSSF